MKETIVRYKERTAFGQCCPQAVLFDMDGVLINSMPNHAVAWQRSMATFDIRMTAADAYATEGARGIDTIRQMVKAQKALDITLDEAQRMYDVKARMFAEMPRAEVMDGAYGLMEQIHRDGLQICVVTGSGQRPLINRLTTDFAPFVDEQHIITAYDVSRGKPHPDPYLMGGLYHRREHRAVAAGDAGRRRGRPRAGLHARALHAMGRTEKRNDGRRVTLTCGHHCVHTVISAEPKQRWWSLS